MSKPPLQRDVSTPTPRRSALRVAIVLAAAVGALTFTTCAAAADDPEIVSMRVGFNGLYKLGCWTHAEVTLAGGDEPLAGRLQVTAEDADGIPADTVTPPTRMVGLEPGRQTTATVFYRPGKSSGPVTVRLLADDRVRATTTFRPSTQSGSASINYPLSATNELVVLAGPPAGVADLIRADRTGSELAATHAARVESVEQLPLEWYGYESVDAVVLTTTEPEFYRPLAQNRRRVEALLEWIERGGRLVLFCGAQAEELLGEDGPLARFVPGEFVGMAPLRETAPIESFIVTDDPLNRGRINIRVPQIENPQGQVLAYGGRNEQELPLVIRCRRGFGEVTFVAVDPDAPPLANWSARPAFLRRALGWRPRTAADDQAEAALLQGGGYDDLSNQLRGALDTKFTGVETASFGLVALLVIAYIAAIGPGDYFFVKRVLKRMELTWITFPATVVVTSLAAYWLANYYKGDQLRLNQVEIVDVDVAAGQARGVAWAHLFNPRVQRFDFRLQPKLAGDDVADAATLVSWLGLAGDELGGMQGQGAGGFALRGNYAFTPALDAMLRTPVPEWSTKTLTARWSGAAPAMIDASLAAVGDGLVEGEIANRSDVTWDDCILLHGRWAYRLSQLKPGATVTVDEDVRPTTVRMRLTAANAGDETAIGAADDGTVQFNPLEGDVTRLAKLMMFYDAISGSDYASVMHRYQKFVDLSDLLEGPQAILLVRAPAPGSQWIRNDEPLGSDQDRRWTFYRFIIPLEDAGG